MIKIVPDDKFTLKKHGDVYCMDLRNMDEDSLLTLAGMGLRYALKEEIEVKVEGEGKCIIKGIEDITSIIGPTTRVCLLIGKLINPADSTSE